MDKNILRNGNNICICIYSFINGLTETVTNKIFCHCYFLPLFILLIKIILEIFIILRFIY